MDEFEKALAELLALGKVKEFWTMLSALLSLGEVNDVTEEQAAAEVKKILGPIRERMVEDEVDKGVVAGKLSPEDRAWARELLEDMPIAAFRTFIRLRKGPSPIAREWLGKKVGISDEQRLINEQCGVSEALFAKYNSPNPAESMISETQAAMNRMVGVKPETFLKYGR